MADLSDRFIVRADQLEVVIPKTKATDAGDDRAGPPSVVTSRLKVESHVADVVAEAFSIAHENLLKRVGA